MPSVVNVTLNFDMAPEDALELANLVDGNNAITLTMTKQTVSVTPTKFEMHPSPYALLEGDAPFFAGGMSPNEERRLAQSDE